MSQEDVMYTHTMSKRLQVLLEEEEMEELRTVARASGIPVSEWVRGAIREARKKTPSSSKEEKLAVIRQACAHDFPTADIDQMLAEVERGYSRGQS